MIIGGSQTKASIVADFISQVYTPCWASVTSVAGRWGTENTPWAGMSGFSGYGVWTNGGHGLLGTRDSEPVPAWPGYENSAGSGSPATTNAFFIMHGFALKLTRHRQGNGYMRYGTGDNTVFIGTQLTSYATNNIVWFAPPTMSAPGDVVTAADVNNFLTSLKNSVDTIRGGGAPAADFVGCHASCHNSCHGSRGRR